MRRLMILLSTAAVALLPMAITSPASAASYKVTASLSRTTVVSGNGVVMSGSIKPGSADKMIHIQKYKKGKWVNLTTTRTDGSGHWSKLLKPTAPGAVKYRAKTSAKASTGAGSSKSVNATIYAWLELAEVQPSIDVSARYFDGGGEWGLVQDGVTSGDDAWVNDDPAGGFGVGRTKWNLHKACIRVRGLAGIDDESSPGAVGHLLIQIDGSGDYSQMFSGGDADQVYLNIRKTGHLTIKSDRHNPDESTVVGFGEPEVLCSRYLPTDS